MSNTTFLIDFENVNSPVTLDFSGCDESDEIILLYTKNIEKISLDILRGLKARLVVFKVPSGSQQLDMHLNARLGFFIGKYGQSRRYTIISKDSDYLKTIEMWREEGYNVTLQCWLGKKPEPLLLPEKTESRQPEPKVEEKKPAPIQKQPKQKKTKNSTATAKTDLNNAVLKCITREFDSTTAGKVASLVVKEYGNPSQLQKIYTELMKTLKKEKGLKAYRLLKKEKLI